MQISENGAPPPYYSIPQGPHQQLPNFHPGQNYPPQQGYQSGPPGTNTVIIDRGGGNDGPGFGTGIAAGMVGGALLGYGLGSCFFPTPGFGMGGIGGGFGGGYVEV